MFLLTWSGSQHCARAVLEQHGPFLFYVDPVRSGDRFSILFRPERALDTARARYLSNTCGEQLLRGPRVREAPNDSAIFRASMVLDIEHWKSMTASAI
jgi:hypothetical protein